MLERYNPDLYSETDAQRQLKKFKDPEYILGSKELNPARAGDRDKAWSMPPFVSGELARIIQESEHTHALPFIMGTYNITDRQMKMNDFCYSDPFTIGLMASGAIESFAVPALRGLYFFGRRGWWRHESIHARHHLQMTYYLACQEDNKLVNRTSAKAWEAIENRYETEKQYRVAGETIHEAGIEELLTRWQASREAVGTKEKISANLAMLLYVEYLPFTGLRNLIVDAKDKTVELIDSEGVRVSLKIGSTVALFGALLYTMFKNDIYTDIGEEVSGVLPVSKDQATAATIRIAAYLFVTYVSAMFSSANKGALRSQEQEGSNTKDYKFPYVYNPVSSTTRSLRLIRYLQKIWDQIPNYRRAENPRSVESIKEEIDQRLQKKLGQKQRIVTASMIEDSLGIYQGLPNSYYPLDLHVKGVFTPTLYLRAKDLITK